MQELELEVIIATANPIVAVLIPCYNEAQTIRKVVEDFQNVLPQATIYVYDNNSSDDTTCIARDAGAIVCHEQRQGKGNVVRSMFRDIDADCYIMADGDDTYPAAFALELMEPIIEGRADMVMGDRLSSTYFSQNTRRFHGFGNTLVTNLINRLFRANLHDIMTGARAFSRSFVKTYPVTSKGFEIETEMTIFALDNNFRIVEKTIDYRNRPQGSESKLNTYSDGLKVLATIGALFRDTRPFAFFNIISALLLLVALAFFIPIFIDYVATGLVERMPTLIMVSGLAVIAILSFFAGIILAVLKKQHRQNFEHTLTMIRYLTDAGNAAKQPTDAPGHDEER